MLRVIIEEAPTSNRPRFLLSRVLLAMGSLREAELVLSGIKGDPTRLKALRADIVESQRLMTEASSLRSRGQHEGAFEVTSKLLKLCWQSAAAYLGRAEDAFQMGYFPVVRHDAGIVLELTQWSNTGALHVLSRALYKSVGNLKSAVVVARRCVAVDPEHAECKASRCSFLMFPVIPSPLTALLLAGLVQTAPGAHQAHEKRRAVHEKQGLRRRFLSPTEGNPD